MIAQKETAPTITIAAVQKALGQLTVLRPLRQQPPFAALEALLGHLSSHDLAAAAEDYHALTSALLQVQARRISGNIFRDYLLDVLLMVPNQFSIQAAQGQRDEALCIAMRYDLAHLGTLFGLNSSIIKDWIGAKPQKAAAPVKSAQDNIALMSSAAWAGSVPTSVPPAAAAPMAPVINGPDTSHWVGWRYALPEELQDRYSADEALEEIYRRLASTDDWGMLLDDIWNFHAGYGTGSFLRHRLFAVTENGLSPLREDCLPQENPITLHQPQQEAMLRNTIRFMRGEQAQNLLLTGKYGMGKTTHVLSLVRELPEVRLVLATMSTLDQCTRALDTLCAQPLRFVVFVDDADFSQPVWQRFAAGVTTARLSGAKLLVMAAAQTGRDGLLPLHIDLEEPDMKTFIDLVQELAQQAGAQPSFQDLQNACIDSKADGEPLNYHTAYHILERLWQQD